MDEVAFKLVAHGNAQREAEGVGRAFTFAAAEAVGGLAVAKGVLDLGKVGRGLQNGQHIGGAVVPLDAFQLGDDAVIIRVQRIQ